MNKAQTAKRLQELQHQEFENINTRNRFGFKDSINCYLTINGERYEQWSDFETKADCQRDHPELTFIMRNGRVYYKVESDKSKLG